MFWLIDELTALNVPSLEGLYLNLFRQIKGGDITTPNIMLCELMLMTLQKHRIENYDDMKESREMDGGYETCKWY
ncbi:hypothetical protein BC937DRAFT_90961 [Endogone sp. FLAS-F59071]|nr:hypothetical protein BC937DRAFT_90961 [Endogone sp. FLAS-F59071]|eukprot:RUS16647.1 hypothetical protein BC937DRAFT_90961 [Endogone sp. FLAS-F59071]